MSTYNNQTGRLAPQSMLQQRYIIVGSVGRGGMGAVYEAIDTRLGHRHMAIKEMSQASLSDTEIAGATARFQQEAHMLGSLSHPNLPRIYDSFSENDRSYLVMDFIEGKTLYQLLKEAQGKPLPVSQIAMYASQLCDVLAYLHLHNPPIIFRDVKPTNVMVTANGHIFLIDFGIARVFKEGQQQDTLFLGSPGYAPPEQHGISQTSPRSDIYGLGATLHYCLTGRDPYNTHPAFSFAPISQYNPQVPVELDQLIQRMVAQDERARPASVLEVRQALLAISQHASEHTNALAPGMVASPALAPTQYMPSKQGPASPPPEQYATVASAPTIAPMFPQQQATQMARPRAPQQTGSPWSTRFLALFGAILVASIGGSFFAINNIPDKYGWALVVEFSLSFLLVLITVIAIPLVRGMLSRSILVVTALAALVSSIAFIVLGSKDMQTFIGQVMQINSNSLKQMFAVGLGINAAVGPAVVVTEQIFTVGLVAAAIALLIWLLRPFSWTYRIILAVLFVATLVCTFLQASNADVTNAGKHVLLLIALIALIQGTLLAIQIERISHKA